MKKWILAPICVTLIAATNYSRQILRKADYPVATVSFRDVQITDAFWLPRIETNRTVTVPGLLARSEKMGRAPDSRVIEAAAYILAKTPDPALRGRVDSALDKMIQGIRARKHRWSSRGDGELPAAGGFMQAAVAYYEATGNRKPLDVAIEIADDIDSVFGPDKRHDISNHEGVKMGLIALYRATGNDRYLRLAKFFLDERGNPAGGRTLYGPYAQDHVPVKSQTRAIGHCVRATYLYVPLTDIAALTGDAEYARANERIWQDAVSKRTYLTGGIGSYRDEEDFGDDYDLPNLACWNEICAAFGNVLWNQRLFMFTQDAKYVDMMERILYNGLLVGVSLKGDTFLYQAPLKVEKGFARQPAFGPNCCPPQIARFLPQLGSLIYAQGDEGLYVNLFVASRARVSLRGTPVAITQETQYPWEGVTRISVDPEKPQQFAVLVRIPGWTRNQPVPSLLYRYVSTSPPTFALTVNGKPVPYVLEKGLAKITREWAKGDEIELTLPMPVRQVVADDRVADDRGMVALERGPLVFCAEGIDNDSSVFNLLVPNDAEFQFVYRPDLLGGIGTITGKVLALSRGRDRVSVQEQPHSFTAIPYYAFGNRGPTQMAVWLAREESKSEIAPRRTIASTSRATSSCGNGTVADNYPGHEPPTIERRFYPSTQDGSGNISAIYDQVEPVNSEDGSSTWLRLRPQSGDEAWVQYDFSRPAKVSSVEVYWKEDKQYCLLPKAWRLLYKDRNVWKPVQASDAYGVERDQYNKVAFTPVTTSGLRIEVELQGKVYRKGELGPPDANYLHEDLTWYEGGVIEWRVNP
jgi:DUF1680 family protein